MPESAAAKAPKARRATDEQGRIEAAVDVLVHNASEAVDAYDQERVDHIVNKASLAALAAHTRPNP